MQLGVWSISGARWTSMVPMTAVTGLIMPWRNWVISFLDHPKAIDLATGEIVHVWSEINSGHQIGSIHLGDPPPPGLALNQKSGIFAVADGPRIHVVSLHDDF